MGSKLRHLSVVAFASIVLVSSSLSAQIRVESGDYAAVPGFELIIPIEIEATQNITGFSFGLRHDPAQLAYADLTPSSELSAVADLESEFYIVDSDPDGGSGVIVALILDPQSADGFLPPGTHPIFKAKYNVVGAANQDTVVEITGDLGSPRVDLIVDVNGGIPRPFDGSEASVTIAKSFRRGDVNGNNNFDLTDAVRILNFLFRGGDIGTCPTTMNVDGSNRDLLETVREIQINDAVALLNYVFLNGVPPADPWESCGQPAIAVDSEMICRQNPACE